VALAIAMTVITTLHMTVGEQAPKIWALERAETVSLAIAYPLRVFVAVLRPLIWTVNLISNTMVRAIGIETGDMHDTVHSVAELRQILSSSASAGQISGRQRLFAENVLALIALEVRHVMLPRVDVAYLSLEHSAEQNLEDLHRCGHSRYPLCKAGLDTVIGIVHTRDVLPVLLEGRQPDLENLARKALVVPDSQPLPRFIAEAQASRRHCAVVIDEHGTTVGLAFLEDALEEIVGPIHDEFDRVQTDTEQNPDGSMVFDGGVPLPDLELFVGEELDDDADTVGGFVVGRLGRLPEPGDQLDFGEHRATVMGVSRRRVTRVRIERIRDESR
jgi:CBS domain containing-hemolysin-like protein